MRTGKWLFAIKYSMAMQLLFDLGGGLVFLFVRFFPANWHLSTYSLMFYWLPFVLLLTFSP